MDNVNPNNVGRWHLTNYGIFRWNKLCSRMESKFWHKWCYKSADIYLSAYLVWKLQWISRFPVGQWLRLFAASQSSSYHHGQWALQYIPTIIVLNSYQSLFRKPNWRYMVVIRSIDLIALVPVSMDLKLWLQLLYLPLLNPYSYWSIKYKRVPYWYLGYTCADFTSNYSWRPNSGIHGSLTIHIIWNMLLISLLTQSLCH